MNAIALLKADHKTVEGLFQQAEGAEGTEKVSVFEKIKIELEAHAYVEETIFYPAL